jgi:glycosyltransferase involved in cell wall biosynthesis
LSEYPLVSVITPVYNGSRYIKETIDSIAHQTFKNYEYIIIDDASKDNSVAVINEVISNLGDNFIFMNRSENRGIAATSMEAIRIARGKYIAIQDQDDISLPSRLQEQSDYLESHSDIFGVSAKFVTFSVDGYEFGYHPHRCRSNEDILRILVCSSQFAGFNLVGNPVLMYRREDFLNAGGYTTRPDCSIISDYEFLLRAFSLGLKFHILDKVLLRYRWHDSNTTVQYGDEMKTTAIKVWAEFMIKYGLKKRREFLNEMESGY